MEHKYLLKRDLSDDRDKKYRHVARIEPKDLPKRVDLRVNCSPVVDQGELGSCTANAIASGLREYIMIRDGHDLVRLSRLFVYYYERQLEGTVYEDAGASLRDGMKIIAEMGSCPESIDPYLINKFTESPSPQEIEAAKQFKLTEYRRIDDLTEMKEALAAGDPVVFGIMIYDSFETTQVARTGIVPLPNIKKEKCYGGHAVCAVGYDDIKGHVIVRNSWGEKWGDKGYFYLPYAFINNMDLTLDMWSGHCHYEVNE